MIDFENIKKLILNKGFISAGVCEYKSVCNKPHKFDFEPKSVIIAVYPYLKNINASIPKIAAYTLLKDYHVLLTEKLNEVISVLKSEYPLWQFVALSDTSPIDEKKAACLAGLGNMGKNNLFISDTKSGSFVLLSEIITSMELEHEKAENSVSKCISCDKCVKACPSNALEGGYNKIKCVSYMNQRSRALRAEEIDAIKKSGYIWGCDICQNVCPLNKNAESVFDICELNYENLYNMTDEEYNEKYKDKAFLYKGKGLMLRNSEIFKF